MFLSLRKFVEADLPALDEWRREISAEQYMEKLAPMAFETSGFEGWGIDYAWFVIQVDGADVGCVWIENKKNQSNIGILGIIIGRLDSLGKGIGRRAIRMAIEQARPLLGFDIVRLHVRQSNARALACYTNCGFVVTGEGSKAHEALGKLPFYRMELFLDMVPAAKSPWPLSRLAAFPAKLRRRSG